MKFKKLTLSESAMDSFDIAKPTKVTHTPDGFDLYDDDFSAPEYIPSVGEDMLEGPHEGSDKGVAGMLIAAINDEWKTIDYYNSVVATLKYESAHNSQYDAFVNVINDIVAEENKHVGQLQEILKQISPNVAYIEHGEREGKSQLGLVGGVLPVQSWDTPEQSASAPNVADDICTISDIDDEM